MMKTGIIWAAALGWAALVEAKPEVRDFGKTRSGEEVQLISLKNSKGMKVEVLTYGAIVKAIEVPDRNGKPGNVVLSTDSIEKYETFNGSAAVIGRVANRIRGASFELEGKTYELVKNAGKHSIHGGKPGFARRVWALDEVGENSVTLSYLSPDGEAGFPGNLNTKVTYSVTEKSELRVDYRASTDQPTLVNLTNHAYFNLAGEGKILDHVLTIPAERYTEADKERIPTEKILPVAGTPLDLTKPTRIGDRIDAFRPGLSGFDHNYVLAEGAGLQAAGTLYDPKSGRVMEVLTTQPGVQIYTGNHLDHRAVCLETQHFPDSIHHKNFPSTVVRPKKGYEETAVFRFSVKQGTK